MSRRKVVTITGPDTSSPHSSPTILDAMIQLGEVERVPPSRPPTAMVETTSPVKAALALMASLRDPPLDPIEKFLAGDGSVGAYEPAIEDMTDSQIVRYLLLITGGSGSEV